MKITIDVHEPVEIVSLLSSTLEVEVSSINSKGYADYLWEGLEGEVHLERKTLSEITGMGKVEDQLRRQMESKPNAKLLFLIEGLFVPGYTGMDTIVPTKNPTIYRASRGGGANVNAFYGWIYQVSKYIEVYTTPSKEATAIALNSFVRGDHKSEHKTFQRYFKQSEFNPDPTVTQVMGAFPTIGEKRAKTLVDKFGTLANIVNAPLAEVEKLPGFGKVLSKQLLLWAGRWDVV